MTMDQMNRSMLNQTIYVAVPTGTGDAAEPTYGSPTARLARVDKTQKMGISADGEDISIQWEIETEFEIPLYSRIWLPGVDHTDNTKALLALNNQEVLGENAESLGWLTDA